MALDILTAAQGGTCAIIHTECCTFIPDESGSISLFLNDLKNQVQTIDNADAYTTEILSSTRQER